ncbi:hypothetical protein [Pyrococcus abyssi]|uniref:Uncharacterized protein n=1 Tax=Pyrococcus abyssi (strain GE5 / Orsay) TaxID=272844 RepID=Q9UY41_PYRAB|nr:hypothetical protein [Pyrococcus abyssi]CAB50571.1 Hypothetical protein PAB1093 [Pyrococcus abyssi GE5]CCE71135.1 TPA: hypothetical protein PAB1093 [Pyrococcus abyssi GE5]
MKIKTVFPKERRLFLYILRGHSLYLISSSFVLVSLTVFYTSVGDIVRALTHFTGFALFLTSYIMYEEFYEQIKRSRFSSLWMIFLEHSPPMGGYAIAYLICGGIFYIVDLIRGGFWILGSLLILRGALEYLISRFIDDLKVVSYLYLAIGIGEVDKLSLIFSK